MVSASIRSNVLTLELLGWHKLWAVKSRLQVPLSSIAKAFVGIAAEDQLSWSSGWKISGTSLPGHFEAGTFRHNGELVFWDAHQDGRQAITLVTPGERYKKVIVDVRHPAALVATIEEFAGG